jgi:hypothetical protein
LTSEFTILVKAVPITIPTARSTTLPLLMKLLNSLIRLIVVVWLVYSAILKNSGKSDDKTYHNTLKFA